MSISCLDIQLQVPDTHLASCDQVGEGSPRLTSGCQDEGVTNAKREEKSVVEIQSTEVQRKQAGKSTENISSHCTKVLGKGNS